MSDPYTADSLTWGLLDPFAARSQWTTDDEVLAAFVRVETELVGAWSEVVDVPGEVLEVVAYLDSRDIDTEDLLTASAQDGAPIMGLVSQLRKVAEDRYPGAGDWVHRGATTQDILDSGLMLVASKVVAEARLQLLDAGASISDLARAQQNKPETPYTLAQPALPSTVGIRAAGWLEGISSALRALAAATTPVQLGGAVGTGEAFDALGSDDEGGDPSATDRLRRALAGRLGLSDPGRAWHTDRAPVTSLAAACLILITAAGRIGRDLTLIARDAASPWHVGGAGRSSAMPHKRNPVDAILLTSAAVRAPGLVSTLNSAALSYDARPAGEWHAEWSALRELLALTAGVSELLASTVAQITVAASDERPSRVTSGASERIVSQALAHYATAADLETA